MGIAHGWQHSKGQQLLAPHISQGNSEGKGTVPDDGQVEAPLQTERKRENRHKGKGTKSQKHNRNQSYTIYNKIKAKNP